MAVEHNRDNKGEEMTLDDAVSRGQALAKENAGDTSTTETKSSNNSGSASKGDSKTSSKK